MLAAVPVLIASLVPESVATSKSHEALEQAAMERLIALRDAKRTQIEDYFGTIQNQVINLAGSTTVIEALDNLRESAGSYRQELFQPDIEKFRSELAGYYSNDFMPAYQKSNLGERVGLDSLMSGLDDDTIALQYQYIKHNSHPLGQ